MNYLLHLFIYLSMYITIALSLNLVVGYLGRLSLAHAGFVAIGAYTYALVTSKLGLGFFPALGAAVAVSVIASFSLSLPSWRFRGDFFVMVSLAVQALIYGVIYNWYSPGVDVGTWHNLTNGPFGIAGINKPDIFGLRLDTIGSYCAMSTGLMVISAIIAYRLTHSPWGRLLKCVHDDELALRSLGKRVRLLKVQTFAIACGMAAVGGVMYAGYVSYIDPSAASLDESILLLCMLCVGGMGNFRGPIVGAAVLLLIPELLRLTPMPSSVAANVRLLAYGLLIVILVHFRPQGIAGEYRVE